MTSKEEYTIPALSWDMARAIGGFTLSDTIECGHGIALGHSKQHGRVAIKPHFKHGKAQNEWNVMNICREMEIPTLEPLALARGCLATYIVTRHERNLMSLAQVNWARTIADRRTQTDLLPRLERAGQDAAFLHMKGVIHNDFHSGNVTYRNGSEFVATDLERASVNVRTRAHLESGAQGDVYRLGATLLVNRGFLGDRSALFRAAALNEHLTMPYIEASKVEVDPDRLVKDWANAAQTGRILQKR